MSTLETEAPRTAPARVPRGRAAEARPQPIARPLTRRWTGRLAAGATAAGGATVAGIGFAGSYITLRALALRKGYGWFAYAFPGGIDAGILVL